MENSTSGFRWSNQPLAALQHMAAEMTSPAAVGFLRIQQHAQSQQASHPSLIKSSGTSTCHNISSSASPPVNNGVANATPHGINDILSRNAAAAAAFASSFQNANNGNPVNVNPRLFFNPAQSMMASASGNKHFPDLRSLYQCWPGMLTSSLVPKNGQIPTGKATRKLK